MACNANRIKVSTIIPMSRLVFYQNQAVKVTKTRGRWKFNYGKKLYSFNKMHNSASLSPKYVCQAVPLSNH